MTAIDDAAEALAKALRPTDPPYAHGWGVLVDPCHAALLELVAAGWTPPSDGSDDTSRLRAEVAGLSAQLDDLNRHIDRLTTEEMAFSEFRHLLVQLAHPAGRNPLRLDSDRQYTAADIQALLVRLLDFADKRADGARRQREKQSADWRRQRERTQLALFEPAAAVRDVERVPSASAAAVGL